eukprot:TRINITY_DN5233_c0_g2_i2.p1 TRINITY_DN5233_c0_g2~~TRINITY_DN5233_c0_g2_i2.p1  ORF type:complete len:158 (-),score=39.15 TRINITY_DN5233_c0_g2_i2:96-569(-)
MTSTLNPPSPTTISSSYELTFDLFSYEEKFWENASTIDHLVVLNPNKEVQENLSHKLSSVVNIFETKKKKRTKSKYQYLYEQVKWVMENSQLKDKSAKKRINLLYNLTWITDFFGKNKTTKHYELELKTWMQVVERSLRDVMYEGINLLFQDISKIR